jgi:hypothetical protein
LATVKSLSTLLAPDVLISVSLFHHQYSATVPQLIQKASPVSPLKYLTPTGLTSSLLLSQSLCATLVKFGFCSSASPTGYHQGCLSNLHRQTAYPQSVRLTSHILMKPAPFMQQQPNRLSSVFGPANLSCSIYCSLGAGFMIASLRA